MAIGNEADAPPFADQGIFRNNTGKSKTLASSGCSIIQFDRPFQFNSSSTPLSGEKGKPGQLTKRPGNTIQPAVRNELPQQSNPPSPIEVCNRAKERLDASARDHRPWAVITTDDQGRAHAILSNSLDERFFHQMQQVFNNNTKLTPSTLQESEFNPGLFASSEPIIAPQHRIGEQFSVPTSRRPSSFDQPQNELGLVRIGKRGPASLDQDSSLEDDDQQCNVVPTVTLTLGAEDAILAFFTTTFKAIQQQALKQILKAWIKELEPHKQKHHPYKGNVKPPYWPQQISFVEPDHQRTEDRIAVAIHIIQFVQNTPVQKDIDPKWTRAGIDTLEISTNSIKLQFDDEPQEKFHKRKILLKQLYDVARQQSHYMKKEKDGDEPIAFQDPMETMRIKRQPRAKRQKTTRETSQTCEPSPASLSGSPDMATDSHFTSSSAAVSPTSSTPINGLSPQYASQFHSEPEQSLSTAQPTAQPTDAPNWNASSFNQHRPNTHQWSASDYNHPGNMHHSLPYGGAPMPQQTFPFTLPGCSPPTGHDPSPANIDPTQYYSSQTQSPTQLNFNAISLDHLGPIPEVKMASQPASAYPVFFHEQHWDSTPASYPQFQNPVNHPPHNY